MMFRDRHSKHDTNFKESEFFTKKLEILHFEIFTCKSINVTVTE